MSEKKLEQELETYRALANENKDVDVATLMVTALQNQQANLTNDKEKKWGYLVSLVLPPFGLLFALKFYLSNKDDGKQAAWICVALTALAILLVVLFAKILFSGSGASLDQIQQIKPADIQQLIQ